MHRKYFDIDNILASDVDHDLQEAGDFVPKSISLDPAHYVYLESPLGLDENFSGSKLDNNIFCCDTGDNTHLCRNSQFGALLLGDEHRQTPGEIDIHNL